MKQILLFASLLLYSPLWAQPFNPTFWLNYSTIDQVQHEKIVVDTETDRFKVIFEEDLARSNPLLSVGEIWKVIRVGKALWSIVEAGKPVATYEADRSHALPQGAENWYDLENWENPKAFRGRMTCTNLLGIQVVDFEYRVIFSPGGQVDGTGAFLANVTVLPATMDLAWGYNFDAQAQILETLNVGTQEDPIAGMEIALNWQVNTPLQSHNKSLSFFVRGDGDFVQME